MTELSELGRLLGAEPPAEFAELSAADSNDLVRRLRHARAAQSRELQKSMGEIVEQLPWPLRKAVQKVVGK